MTALQDSLGFVCVAEHTWDSGCSVHLSPGGAEQALKAEVEGRTVAAGHQWLVGQSTDYIVMKF